MKELIEELKQKNNAMFNGHQMSSYTHDSIGIIIGLLEAEYERMQKQSTPPVEFTLFKGELKHELPPSELIALYKFIREYEGICDSIPLKNKIVDIAKQALK